LLSQLFFVYLQQKVYYMIYDDELYGNEDMWDDEYDYDPYTNYWYEEDWDYTNYLDDCYE